MDIDKYYNIAVNKLKYDNYFWLGEEQINKRKKGCVKTSYEYTDDTLYTICPKCGNKYQENRYFECPNCKSKTKKQKLSGYGVVRCNCGFKYNSRIHEVCPNCNKKR